MPGFRALDERRGQQRFSGAKAEGGTVLGKYANTACRFARVAHPTTVEDHSVAQQSPLIAFDQFTDSMLHLDWILFGRPTPSPH